MILYFIQIGLLVWLWSMVLVIYPSLRSKLLPQQGLCILVSTFARNYVEFPLSEVERVWNALRACCKGIKIGKILIHRDGDNRKQLIYEKLPQDICERHVLLLDPVLATGNSANEAIELLMQKGLPESHIIFLNLISAPEGIHCVCKRFPSLKIITSEIDATLNEEYRVIPGLGEFGDRYFGTDD